MTKQVLLYCVHRNIPWFLSFTLLIFFLEILLDKISFMKIKKFKPKHQNLNSKSNGPHFVKFIQNTPIVAYGKVSQRGSL